MSRTKVKEQAENLQEPQEVDSVSSFESDVSEVTTGETTPENADDSKPKKQTHKEPANPFLLIADLGRSSCKNLISINGVMSKGVQPGQTHLN